MVVSHDAETASARNHATRSSTSSAEISARAWLTTPFMSLLSTPVRTANQSRPRRTAIPGASAYAASCASAAC